MNPHHALDGPELSTLEAALRDCAITVPAEPALDELLAAAGRLSPRPSRPTLPLVWRVALSVVALGVTTVALQFSGVRLPWQTARLTPWRQINATWKAADGYVLDFTVFDADLPAGQKLEGNQPNLDRFKAAALHWADEHGLSHREQLHLLSAQQLAQLDPDKREAYQQQALVKVQNMGFEMKVEGGGRCPGQYMSSTAQIRLRLTDSAAAYSLVNQLSSLPGVSWPEMSPCTLYWGLGPVTPELDGEKVIINGTPFVFPTDFTPDEAQSLYWHIRGAHEHEPQFLAFPRQLLGDEHGHSRIPLGDVVRLGLDRDGNVIISNVLDHWTAGLAGWDSPHRVVTGGWSWSFVLPDKVAESSIDPVQELSRKFDPLPGDRDDERYSVSLRYWLIPQTQLLTQGGLSFTVQQRRRTAALAQQLTSAVDAWIAQHPRVKRSLVWHDRATCFTNTTGPPIYPNPATAFMFTAEIQTNDLTEAADLQAALARVPGAPVPDVDTFDQETKIKRGLGP